MSCEFCDDYDTNSELNELSIIGSDIHVKIHPRGLMRCRHYDWEGDFDDDRVDIPINFCPVCGRALKK